VGPAAENSFEYAATIASFPVTHLTCNSIWKVFEAAIGRKLGGMI